MKVRSLPQVRIPARLNRKSKAVHFMTTAFATTIFPSAPKVHEADLPTWRLLPAIMNSSLSIWPNFAFDILVNKRTTLGVTSILVNDPEESGTFSSPTPRIIDGHRRSAVSPFRLAAPAFSWPREPNGGVSVN